MDKRQVILVTDGDRAAQKAIEVAAANIGGRCISASAGNPTLLKGEQIAQLIKKAANDPVVVMADDRGVEGIGDGEAAMKIIMEDDSIDLIGIIAVSSNGDDCYRLNVSCSITKEGKVIEGIVDKFGNEINKKEICGDTLSILQNKNNIIIVGIGDPGKMEYNDDISKGAPITTRALREVMERYNKAVNSI